MSFDYNKNKNTHSSDSFWTSYSDLFLGLSTIFLLLYVTASLRTGTDAIRSQVDNQKLSMKVEELQNQLKMYEAVKTDYLEKEASKDEAQEYNELMDKLTLLQEEAKSDQERLAREALENEQKAKALNKYQQMVRNIINANKVAKTKLIARKEIIAEQDTTIDVQRQNINTLEADIAEKKRRIEEGERQIAQVHEALESKKEQLLKAYKANQITKQMYEQKTQQLQETNDRKIRDLQMTNQEYAQQMDQLTGKLSSTQAELDAKSKLAQSLQRKADNLKANLSRTAQEAQGLRGQIAALRDGFAQEQARERAAFEAELKKGQLEAAERSRREAAFKAAAAAKEKAMNDKIAGLQGQLQDTEGALAKAKEEIDARRQVAQEIKKGFAAAGVKADVDMQTGEVVLDFGDAYFDSDSANLKAEMKRVIERAIPIYSRSLFGNPKVARKVSSVEVVGFASPTYQGRYVDPNSDRPEDKAAMKYNMDLSYRRANSIFSYLLENAKEFKHQKNLMSLMKVSGRSFLEVMNVKDRGPATAAEFCKVNDCKKAQRVIVRFSMDGRGE
ncbi:MAG: microtubule-binding protein [Bdellovibrionales bacterium]